MKVFLDTNILLDIFTVREPYYTAASRICNRVEIGVVDGYVSAISFNNSEYVVRRIAGAAAARESLKSMRDCFRVVPLDEQILNRAIDSDFTDFEDAIQYFSAQRAQADCLLTRNVRHFPVEPIAVQTPEQFLAVNPAV